MALHLILDTETTTLLGVHTLVENDPQNSKDIATTFPLVYDIGWVITNDNGEYIAQYDYLVKEIFTDEYRVEAYYKDKWPIYQKLIDNGELQLLPWQDIMSILDKCRSTCEDIEAYNASFDFFKAIPYTEEYLKHTNDPAWREAEFDKARNNINAGREYYYPDNDTTIWNFRGQITPIYDIWPMACRTIMNTLKYKTWTIKHGYFTDSAVRFITNAEACQRYMTGDLEWSEDHTALSDALIESQIFHKIQSDYHQKENISNAPPSVGMGRIVDFIEANKYQFNLDDLNRVYDQYEQFLTGKEQETSAWLTQVRNCAAKLDEIRKEYCNMKKFSVKLRYMDYKNGSSLDRPVDINIPWGLSPEKEDDAITNAIADITNEQWMEMDFDSVIEVKQLSKEDDVHE